MRIIARAAIVMAAVSLTGCDYLPDYAKALISRQVTAKDVSAGAFTGQLKVIFLEAKTPSDRNIQLIEGFGYKDRNGVEWSVPEGFVSDGASIPWELWPFIGGPFDGPYRDAAVLHDYYCEQRTRTWEQVHAMFLEAALRRGVLESTAQTMYAGILYGGPRWDPPKTPLVKAQMTPTPGEKPRVDPGLTRREPTAQEKADFEELRRWIQETKPTPDQIKERVEQMRKAKK